MLDPKFFPADKVLKISFVSPAVKDVIHFPFLLAVDLDMFGGGVLPLYDRFWFVSTYHRYIEHWIGTLHVKRQSWYVCGFGYPPTDGT